MIGLDRREAVAIFGGALLTVGCKMRSASRVADAAPGTDEGTVISHYVQIADSGAIRLILPWTEVGQGISTGLATLLGEELSVDPAAITFVTAGHNDRIKDPDFDSQETGGGAGLGTSWDGVRKAAAAAREMLVSAAAKNWGVPEAECDVDGGAVVHTLSQRRTPFANLVASAAASPVPANPRLKDPGAFKYIGQSVARIDLRDKITGAAKFGVDTVVDGMLTGTVLHSPNVGGKALAVDDSAARQIPGFTAAVSTPYGVAIVAETFAIAQRAAPLVRIQWDAPYPNLSSAGIFAEQRQLVETDGMVAETAGSFEPAFAQSNPRLVSYYQTPHLPHATMEPQNCTAWVKGNGEVEVWAPTQSSFNAQKLAAKIAGTAVEKVVMHVTLCGGAFGRRLRQDYVAEAVYASMALKKPVKLIWTRDEDFARDYYRPATTHKIEAGLDASGKISAWRHRLACSAIDAWDNDEPPVLPGPLPEPDQWAVEGAIKQPYAIPNKIVHYHQHESGVPVTWLRGVGHSHTAFAVESMIDDLARASGQDPLAFRLAMLAPTDDYYKAVSLAAEKAGWRGGQGQTPGAFQGLAVHESLGSTVAHVVEIRVTGVSVKVLKVTTAVVSGLIVNPDVVRQSMESSVVQGLSATLHQAITFQGGRIQQRMFTQCKLLAMMESPDIDVYFVPGGTEPRSIDSGVPAVAPAVCNALFAATGKRMKQLPISLA